MPNSLVLILRLLFLNRGKDSGYTKKNSNACVLIPVVNSKHITPHSEGMQAVIWHMIVSHPKLKVNKTKWESLK